MDQQLPLANIITLGVRDFAREREFYHRPGWPHVFDSDAFTVFGCAVPSSRCSASTTSAPTRTPRHATPRRSLGTAASGQLGHHYRGPARGRRRPRPARGAARPPPSRERHLGRGMLPGPQTPHLLSSWPCVSSG